MSGTENDIGTFNRLPNVPMHAFSRMLPTSAREVLTSLGVAAAEAATWVQLTELGWRQLTIPESQGGLGQNLAAVYILQDRLADAEKLNKWVIKQKPKDEDTLENAYFNLFWRS